ncbi:hypothetical protein PoB_004909300 [Plakobranchus ocellatus]|uniref:Uncharacterized protein n=1 Tax=Plakobranchus ocellatus TaxID=259542 RepID=A0AAV4BUW3_9GAST|nr:hypothetical protein PoB_004909300 [Plakobranchus ocellatus]
MAYILITFKIREVDEEEEGGQRQGNEEKEKEEEKEEEEEEEKDEQEEQEEKRRKRMEEKEIKKSFTHLDPATHKSKQDRRREKITTFLSRIRTRTLVGTHHLARQRNQANKPLNHPLPQKGSILLKSSAKSLHPTRVYFCARRTNFTAKEAKDWSTPDIKDVQLLSGGWILLTDSRHSCVKLFDTQGRHIHSLQCRDRPYRLAVLDSSGASKCITVVVTLPACSAIDILEVARDDIKVKVSSSKFYSVTLKILTFPKLSLSLDI